MANSIKFDETLALARSYCAKEGNSNGGALHCVLEDGNVEANIIRSSLECAKQHGDVDGALLAEQLLQLPIRQRERLVNLR